MLSKSAKKLKIAHFIAEIEQTNPAQQRKVNFSHKKKGAGASFANSRTKETSTSNHDIMIAKKIGKTAPRRKRDGLE